jgi:hypothetical protein
VAGARRCQLLTDAEGVVALSGKGAIVPNVGGTGYYRFELPANDWDALIGTAARLPGGEAQALSDSLYASFRAGRATPQQLIAGAEQLARNRDSYASGSAMDALDTFHAAEILTPEGEAGYRRLVTRIYAPSLARMGFNPAAGAYASEDPEKSQQREQVIDQMALSARDPQLRDQLAVAGKAYLGGDSKALDPTWFNEAFSVLLDEGGLDLAKQLMEKGLASQDPAFRPAALRAVAGSGNPLVGTWLLGFADPRMRNSERLGLIRGVIADRGTRDMGFDWLKAHFDEVAKGGGGIFFTAGLPRTVSGFCSTSRADEIQALLGPRLAGKTGALELARTVERVRSCGTLKDARAAELSAALAKVK